MNQEEINAKARELVEKYLPLTRVWQDEGGWLDDIKAAKRCALIDIQNTIDAIKGLFDKGLKEVHQSFDTPKKLYGDVLNPYYDELLAIKQAIENL